MTNRRLIDAPVYRRKIYYICLTTFWVVISTITTQAQSQSGLLYVTANGQIQEIMLFGMPAIAPRPSFLGWLLGGDNRIRGDYFPKDFFSVTAGYHLNDKWRLDLGYNRYFADDRYNGIYRLGKGATYRATHTIRVVDIPLRASYNLRHPTSTSKWIWYLIGSLSYTDIQWKRDFGVTNSDRSRRIHEERSFNNLFVGVGAGVRYQLFRGVAPYYQLGVSWGTLRGAFAGGAFWGLKFNLNVNQRYVISKP